MPIRGKVDGEEIYATDLSAAEATRKKIEIREKGLTVLMVCCGNKGHLKISGNMNPFFCHNPGTKNDCNWKSETKEHRLIKEIIRQACIDMDWEATTEYSDNNDWRADVYATNGVIKVAFEVQLSKQNYPDTVVRNNKYSAAGVHCCWLFKNMPNVIDFDHPGISDDHRMYEVVFNGNDEISILDGNKKQSVYNFVQDYLSELNLQHERKNNPVDEALEINHIPIYQFTNEEYDDRFGDYESLFSDLWRWIGDNKYWLFTALIFLLLVKAFKRK